MEANMWVLLVVLIAIALAAPRYGVDSRWPGPGEPPRPLRPRATVRGDLVALARRVAALRRSHWPWVRTSTVLPPSSRHSAL